MSDIIPNDTAQLSWRKLCEAAVLELDPEKLPGRIAEARTAVLAQMDDGFPSLSEGERLALHDALEMLLILQDVAKREIREKIATGDPEPLAGRRDLLFLRNHSSIPVRVRPRLAGGEFTLLTGLRAASRATNRKRLVLLGVHR